MIVQLIIAIIDSVLQLNEEAIEIVLQSLRLATYRIVKMLFGAHCFLWL